VFVHAVGEVVAAPFRMLAIRRHVIATLTRRDLRGRYASSVMGLSWAVIQPLALLVLFTFVFSVILRIRFGGSSSAYFFAAYVFCGMLPWIALQERLSRSSSVIIENVRLIKKVIFPSEILCFTPWRWCRPVSHSSSWSTRCGTS